MELSSRFGVVKGGKFGTGMVKLVGIVKEVDADASGVIKFQEKYFKNNDLYMDHEKLFYKELGNHKLVLPSWNPYKLYLQYHTLVSRMREKKIGGNFKGEGLLKGGLFVVHPTAGVVYSHEEITGVPMPYGEIERVVVDLLNENPTGEQ